MIKNNFPEISLYVRAAYKPIVEMLTSLGESYLKIAQVKQKEAKEKDDPKLMEASMAMAEIGKALADTMMDLLHNPFRNGGQIQEILDGVREKLKPQAKLLGEISEETTAYWKDRVGPGEYDFVICERDALSVPFEEAP